MKAKQVLELVRVISDQKHLTEEEIFSAVEYGLAEAARRNLRGEQGNLALVRVAIDRNSGEYSIYRRWRVVAEDYVGEEAEEGEETPPDLGLFSEHKHLRLGEAKKKQADLEEGGYYEEPLEVDFGRIAAQKAYNVINRHIRDAERAQVISEYENRVGELMTGTVERVMREGYLLTLKDRVEAILPRSKTIGDEHFFVGNMVHAILTRLNTGTRGYPPQLVLSRTAPEMLIELFKMEVPEVAEQVIEIRAVARELGSRAKVAVKTNDGRIDPVGVCVGMRGTRVQAVTESINNERVDVILWDEDPEKLVRNALLPAQVQSVFMDAENNVMEVAVPEDSLAQAVGTRGENVRLAKELLGCEISILSLEEAQESLKKKKQGMVQSLAKMVEIDEATSNRLVEAGITGAEELAEAGDKVLAELGLAEEAVADLKEKASGALMVQMLGESSDLAQMDGVDDALYQKLTEHEITSRKELADCSVDHLLKIEGIGEKRAAELIMQARRDVARENEEVPQ